MSLNANRVKKIGDHTIVKGTYVVTPHLEGAAFEFVRMRTTIPIPRIRRTIEDEEGYTFIVMDYIPGERLDHVWPSLSLWSKLWVALTLRRYIRQLRQINSSVPGPVADSPQKCDNYMFVGKPCGPFPDYASLPAFYNRKLDIAKKVTFLDGHGNTIRCARPDSEPFDDSRPIYQPDPYVPPENVVAHDEVAMSEDKWGQSGFYPPWFEYVSTVYAAENDTAPDSWNRLITFISDPLFKHMKWIGQLVVALIAYR